MEETIPMVFTVIEVAQKLRVSTATIRRQMQQGLLIPIRIGHRVFITEWELTRYLHAIEQKSKPVVPLVSKTKTGKAVYHDEFKKLREISL